MYFVNNGRRGDATDENENREVCGQGEGEGEGDGNKGFSHTSTDREAACVAGRWRRLPGEKEQNKDLDLWGMRVLCV